ncbi:MAG TPA: ABC transporter substrate-binding protein [Gemmobacter sp.]|nr:ABC transporter substrate-binding protein [Gemmobacter sp.]
MRSLAVLAFCAMTGAGAQADTVPPARVVSMNLCTDQLAMLLAAPGQLISISDLARDSRSSAMAEQAVAYPVNHARAEEIYLLEPDLVLAGSYSDAATLTMLERLGIRVERFPPAFGLEAVEDGLRRMGDVLGQPAQGAAMAEAFAKRRARLAVPADGPLAATYAANGYTNGGGSLSGEIVKAAGFRNLGESLGMQGGGVLPLELLLLADPALVISGNTYPGASRSEEILRHPALLEMTAQKMRVEDRDWLCGLPAVLDVVERLGKAREALQ